MVDYRNIVTNPTVRNLDTYNDVYHVSVNGSDSNDGLSLENAFFNNSKRN